MEMEDQYGIADLRQLMNGRPHFPVIPPPADLFSTHRNLTPNQHFDMLMVGRQVDDLMTRGLHHEFPSDSTTTTTATAASTATAALSGFEADLCYVGGDGGTGRWPRQETLTLLEIRSRLDYKFKEANQKGPLWDEVSRIMSEEHGYQRSGKKCREKFENLYKYYKKTKEGKAGRQDGKHYRFFRQLEALYGETTNNLASASDTHYVNNRFHAASNITATQANNPETFQTQKLCDSLSLSNSSDFETSSSDDNDVDTVVENDSGEKRRKRRGKRSWKSKIRDFIDSQMRRLMEKQEAWLEKMLKTLEHKEQERMLREEEWRKQEASRLDRQHKFWSNERAWIKARDAALMGALQKLTGKEVLAQPQPPSSPDEALNNNVMDGCDRSTWEESEITRLLQLRVGMESRFQQSGCPEEVLWEDIAAQMACVGYERSALMCKDKWSGISESKECNKKRKENSRSCSGGYYPNDGAVMYGYGHEVAEQGREPTMRVQQNDSSSSPSNVSNAGAAVHDSCFRFLMGDGDGLWESHGRGEAEQRGGALGREGRYKHE